MYVYYCDGSQSEQLNHLGLGVVFENEAFFSGTNDFVLDTHEVKAMEYAIKIAISKGHLPLTIVNDSRSLIMNIERGVEIKQNNRKVKSKKKYRDLINLVERYEIKIKRPETPEDRYNIWKAHYLSRTYIYLEEQMKAISI
jgi:ribonuclease HI